MIAVFAYIQRRKNKAVRKKNEKKSVAFMTSIFVWGNRYALNNDIIHDLKLLNRKIVNRGKSSFITNRSRFR